MPKWIELAFVEMVATEDIATLYCTGVGYTHERETSPGGWVLALENFRLLLYVTVSHPSNC